MPREPNAQEQITAFSSAHTGFALSSQTDSLAFANATGDFDLIVFDFVRACPAQRDRSRGSVQRFFQCDHDVGFDIGPALRCRLTSAKSTESRAATASAEKRFEEIAEASPAGVELHACALA